MKTNLLLFAALSFLLFLSCEKNSTNPVSLPADGLLAHFPFDGNTIDISENKYQGISYGIEYVEDRNSEPLSSAIFNGNQWIVLPTELRFNAFESKTIAFWINTKQKSRFDLFDQRVGSHSPSLYNFGIFINYSDQYLIFNYPGYRQEPSPTEEWTSSLAICDSSWHHLTFLYDHEQENLMIYLDGVIQRNSIYPTEDFVTSGDLLIGMNFQGTNAFSGVLDDLLIYDRALSQNEVLRVYNY